MLESNPNVGKTCQRLYLPFFFSLRIFSFSFFHITLAFVSLSHVYVWECARNRVRIHICFSKMKYVQFVVIINDVINQVKSRFASAVRVCNMPIKKSAVFITKISQHYRRLNIPTLCVWYSTKRKPYGIWFPFLSLHRALVMNSLTSK